MSGCCGSGAYDEIFSEKQARKDLRRYRRRGLAQDARGALGFLRARGIEGASVLEVGGGIGALQLELLRAGAARAVDVELSRGYEAAAAELLAGSGFEDRVERRIGDVVEEPSEPEDAVAMIRVVCCYPDVERLVGAAAAHARRLLVLSYPPDGPLARAVIGTFNLVHRLSGSEFRAFAHPHARIRAAAEAHGLRLVHREHGAIWHVAGYERVGAQEQPGTMTA
jgi:magnesium-protoporphyrin O-methyltransferase